MGTSPFSLVYRHDAVLPTIMMVRSLQVAMHNKLSHLDYSTAMMVELDDINET